MTRRASDRHLAAVPDGFFFTRAFLMHRLLSPTPHVCLQPAMSLGSTWCPMSERGSTPLANHCASGLLLINLLAHHTQDHQAKELINACLGLPLVEPESRAAIGARRKQTSLPAGSEDPRREHRGDGRSSLEPDGKRRHGEPGVLAQERHESRDVRLLPQGHIAVQQGVDVGARLCNRGLTSDVPLLQSASGTLQSGIYGGNGEV